MIIIIIGIVGRVFASGPGDLGPIPGRVISKTLKMVLDTPCLTLSNIRYVSSGAIQRKELRPPLHLGVVAIEKGVFWSPSPTVANFTFTSNKLGILYMRKPGHG